MNQYESVHYIENVIQAYTSGSKAFPINEAYLNLFSSIYL